MTDCENYLAIARRRGYEYMPVHFNMCPSLKKRFEEYVQTHELFIPKTPAVVAALPMICRSKISWLTFAPARNLRVNKQQKITNALAPRSEG